MNNGEAPRICRDLSTQIAPSRKQHARQPAPTAVKLILPVWGYKYVRQFLNHGLPTLLAPGNLPAVAQILPSQFILLTSIVDEIYIRESTAFKRLAAVCPTEIRLIDHLITAGNSSTTITLGYTEVVRSTGEAMLDTCFFFLVSDYIVADGSLANALERVRSGASGVLIGNFQVALEDALPWLEDKLQTAGASLALQLEPREMMRWALNHLHPASIGNMVNFPLNHNTHSNRLFWRVDSSTLLGRFYLMHMLCIRPEVTQFVIGSSCDYSFVPELCPSGNVQVMTDSDHCLIIEMQPRDHEAKFLRPGPLKPGFLARSLEEWTTAGHRGNAQHSVVYHAEEVPSDIARSIAEAAAFIDAVTKLMRREPHPHLGHDYWRGAIASFNDATGKVLDPDEWRLALGHTTYKDRFKSWIMYRAQYAVLGRPPFVTPLHPSWPDYRLILKWLGPFFLDPAKRLLMVSEGPTVFTASLADNGERTHRLQLSPFLESASERYEPLEQQFDLCLIELSEGEMARGDELIDRVSPLLKPEGTILVAVQNRRSGADARGFGQGVSYHSVRFMRAGARPTEIQYVPASSVRWQLRYWLARLRNFANSKPALGVPSAFVGGGLFLLAGMLGSIDGLRRTRRSMSHGISSSVLLTLTVDASQSKRLHLYSGYEASRRRRRRHGSGEVIRGARSGAGLRHVPSGIPAQFVEVHVKTTREEQYSRCVEIKNKNGLTPLGLMANQVWYDDPRRLTFVLARYKFVAKMLSGRRHVGEVGCGDAFGTRIVLQEVEQVTVYDFDPTFIEDVRSRQDERWHLRAYVHDITEAPLPAKHDGLFSLDVLEHIAPLNEHAFLFNLRGSLTDEGVLIIGTPSLESQTYASPLSKAGHVNCKSGDQLKSLLERYFTRVFMFSMNDEMVHTGFYPMAHYLFAICTGPK